MAPPANRVTSWSFSHALTAGPAKRRRGTLRYPRARAEYRGDRPERNRVDQSEPPARETMTSQTVGHRPAAKGTGALSDSNPSSTAKDLVELLIKEGLVDRAKVAPLLVEQRKSGDRIVALLLQRKLIGEAELVAFLSKRYRIPPIALNGRAVPA